MDRPQVSLTSTIAVLNDKNEVLVIKRKNPPFQDCWALPGGFLDENETFVKAAARELKEETGLDFPGESLTPIGLSDDPDRDPRGRVIDMVYLLMLPYTPEVEAADDAVDFTWIPLATEGLAFDHDQALVEIDNWL